VTTVPDYRKKLRQLDEDIALAKTAKTLAATDPDRAERMARSITADDQLRDGTLFRITERVAATDPDRAERVARGIADDELRAQAMAGIAYERRQRHS
jgi:hypothetical protein